METAMDTVRKNTAQADRSMLERYVSLPRGQEVPEQTVKRKAGSVRPCRVGAEFCRLRDEVILVLLRETDVRPEELSLLAVADYNHTLMRLTPASGRHVPLNRDAADLLEEYLGVLEHCFMPSDNTPNTPLFFCGNGDALHEKDYWNLIRQDLRLAGTSALALVSAAFR